MSNKQMINGVKASSVSDGKLQSFDILFDNADAIYTSGDEITGNIRISLKEPMKMRMVKLQFKGHTKVGWAEQKVLLLTSTTKKNEKTTTTNETTTTAVATTNGTAAGGGKKSKFLNEIVHIDKTIDLLERRPGQELPADFVLPSGVNLLPFSFPLPKKNLPTSFESECGFVRYYCRAVICKPWKHDYATKRPFTVLSSGWKYATKENYADLYKPAAVSEDVASKSCCCIKGHITCELSLPKQAYNIGEWLIVGAKLVNNSRRTVSKATFRLVQIITCKGQSKDSQGERTTVINRVLAEKVFDKPIQRGSTADWNQEKMFKIPPCVPSIVDNAVLRVEYQLRADIETAANRPKEALSVRLPITVFGIPYTTAASPRSREEKKDEKPYNFLPCYFGPKSVRDDDDDQFTRGALEFAPMYPSLVD